MCVGEGGGGTGAGAVLLFHYYFFKEKRFVDQEKGSSVFVTGSW